MCYNIFMDIQKVWKNAQAKIADKVSSVSFDLWIKTLTPEAFENGEYILAATSTAAKQHATNDRHFPHISDFIKEAAPIVEKVTVIDAVEQERRAQATSDPIPATTTARVKVMPINPTKTFDNFIVGKSNEFVAAAAEAVAKTPGTKFNPLFIYGRSGLGKTHLLNAIANHVMTHHPKMSIVLTTCNDFTNDYISALDKKHVGLSQFRARYQDTDVLLIDDIQFLANRRGTQEEFFETFNSLHQNGKQIVITSDRHPDEIATLEERMRSRFKSGLFQDIGTPDVEMRIAILKKKALLENHRLDEEVVDHIATHAYDENMNVRDMEGILFKVIFYSQLKNRPSPTMEDCHAALQTQGDEDRKVKTNADSIIKHVCKYFNITKDEMVGKRRNREFVEPRMFAVYLISEILNIPLAGIGQLMGGRDHATIIHARKKIATQAKTDTRSKRIIEDLTKLIKAE